MIFKVCNPFVIKQQTVTDFSGQIVAKKKSMLTLQNPKGANFNVHIFAHMHTHTWPLEARRIDRGASGKVTHTCHRLFFTVQQEVHDPDTMPTILYHPFPHFIPSRKTQSLRLLTFFLGVNSGEN